MQKASILMDHASYTAAQLTRFGFLNIDISNGIPHTKLTGTFYNKKGDEVRDQFTIEKEIQVKNLTITVS